MSSKPIGFISSSHMRLLLFTLLLLLVNICLPSKQQQHGAVAAADDNILKSKAQSTLDLFPALNEFSTHTVIRPQLEHARHKRAIQSTLDEVDGLHIPHITLSYYHEGQKLLIDLKRNDELLPDEHFLRYQNANKKGNETLTHTVENFTKTEISLCHYQGTIRGKPNSSVAVSTCNGINGILFDGIDTYFIHSGSDGRLQDEHYLFRHSDMVNRNASCGYDSSKDDHTHDHHADFAWQPSADVNVPNRLDGSEFNRILRYKRSYDSGQNVIRGPYNANKHSSYVELVIVVDNKVFKMFGENVKKVHQHCKDLANIVNALYVPLNIFVALVGVVIWNESNEIDFSPNGDVTLRNFLNYRRTKLVLEHPNDNAQLLTKEHFEAGVVGKALKGPICTHEYSGGFAMQHSEILAVVATTIAHEIGHNFGMEHDSSDCKCQDTKCIMAASSTEVVPLHWSSCSIDQLNIAFSRGMNYCLRNKPTKLFDSPQCGNGFVEPGEQCDCGLPNYCENTCCDPHTCMLHTNASCATGECCDLKTCRPKVAGSACRAAENECDLPEYCTGESEYCPANVFKRDTQECDSGRAYCFQGNCRSHSNQCRILWGPTGENSEHCYNKNVEGKRGGNCGYNRLNNTFIPCEKEHVECGLLHCRHLNERLEFGMESAAVLSHWFINHEGSIVPCRTALVDLGLQSTDPGLTPNGAKCGTDKMCVNQQCRSLEQVHAEGIGQLCPDNCNGNGVCNSRGNCHCDIGFGGASCLKPGPGGSADSGPATNPNSHEAFQRFIYIFFFAVVPFMALFCVFIYYCRQHPFFFGGKLAENMYVPASIKSPCSFSTSSSDTTHSASSTTSSSSPSSASSAHLTSLAKKPNTLNLCSTTTQSTNSTTNIVNCPTPTSTPNTSSKHSHSHNNNLCSSFNHHSYITPKKPASHGSATINARHHHQHGGGGKSQALTPPPPIAPASAMPRIQQPAKSQSNYELNIASVATAAGALITPTPPPPITTSTVTIPPSTSQTQPQPQASTPPTTTPLTTIIIRKPSAKRKPNTDQDKTTTPKTQTTQDSKRNLEITDIRLHATTNRNALTEGTEYISSDPPNRCVYQLSSTNQAVAVDTSQLKQ